MRLSLFWKSSSIIEALYTSRASSSSSMPTCPLLKVLYISSPDVFFFSMYFAAFIWESTSSYKTFVLSLKLLKFFSTSVFADLTAASILSSKRPAWSTPPIFQTCPTSTTFNSVAPLPTSNFNISKLAIKFVNCVSASSNPSASGTIVWSIPLFLAPFLKSTPVLLLSNFILA